VYIYKIVIKGLKRRRDRYQTNYKFLHAFPPKR